MSQGNPSNNANLRVVQLLPPASDSAFRCVVPPTWERLPVLSEEPDFSDPTAFALLGAFMEDAGSVIATVAARPAHDTGSPARWLAYLASELGFEVLESGPVRLSDQRMLAACRATQAGPRGPMTVRLALFEDQGQWVLVTAMSVDSPRESMEAGFLNLLETFKLLESQIPATPTTHGARENSPIPFPTGAIDHDPEDRAEGRELLRPGFRFARA